MDREYCFVLMPFADQYRSLFDNVIVPAVKEVHLACKRADSDLPGSIMKEIICGIFEAKVVITVLDSLNPNVMYELAVAHALGRPTIAVIQEAITIPFDIVAYRVSKYKDEENLRKILQASLDLLVGTLKIRSDELSNPVVDNLPIKYPSLIATVRDIQNIESSTDDREVWIMGPDCASDISLYSSVMKRNICDKKIKYKYILAESGRPGWLQLRECLDLPSQLSGNLTVKFISDDSIESDIVIYNPFLKQQLKVYLKPAIASTKSFYICLDPGRGAEIRRRFNILWNMQENITGQV